MRRFVNAISVLMAGAVFADTVPVTAPEEMRKIPFIYCSDIFHPAVDPDDHFDLAAGAAAFFGIGALILCQKCAWRC